jgi:UDP-N-acetylmuramoyl-L-alanyl-D-glutamate--2,6-diaminopimelate ligase
MHTLNKLLQGLDTRFICGDPDTIITSVDYDSRKVTKGSLFVSIRGYVTDGHRFIDKVIEQNAAAILIEDDQDLYTDAELIARAREKGIAIVSVFDTRLALAHVSAAFFSHPSDSLAMVGITGTKGKTTTTYMIRDIFEKAQRSTGLIGTVANIIAGEVEKADRTTPESYKLQEMLARMVDKGQDSCVMEVSSQGLMLSRVYGCRFDVGAFTNLYHDHIGEHEHSDMDDYLKAKLLIFDQSDVGLINADSAEADRVIKYAAARCPYYTYGIDKPCDVSASDLKTCRENNRIGTSFVMKSPWYNGRVFVAMPGKFNVYNALCAAASAGICGLPFEAVLEALADVSVPGRLQAVPCDRGFTVLVDYAHNAASLENLLTTLREYCPGRLITVFGCGGDRAKSRRYEMGEVSGALSDLTVITSDNPRSEDPAEIIADIMQGFSRTDGKSMIEPDRRTAIEKALSIAEKDDFVIIAGKGHEDYQIFRDRTIHFDDAETAAGILARMNSQEENG